MTGVGCHFLLQGVFPTQGSNCVSYIGRWTHTTSPPGKPTTKNYLAEDVNSAEVEKPWFNSTAASQSQLLETDVLGLLLPLPTLHTTPGINLTLNVAPKE